MSIGVIIACCILSGISLIIGIAAFVLALSMKLSTHKIEWRNPFPETEEEGFMTLKQMNEKLKKENEDIESDFV